jgi:phosphocarrier protein FPr/phosphocarrier protein
LSVPNSSIVEPSRLVVAAPIDGWVAPLDEAPDAVFAERMMGDGIAIDPTGSTLVAPFDGVVAALPASRHAVVLRADCGAEVLMHVGLETVALGGEGFVAHVKEGGRVRRGDPLLSFDLDALAQRARSLITPIVLTNGERFAILDRAQDRRVAAGEPVMALAPRGEERIAATGGDAVRAIVTLAFEHGLHARPAAAVARAAQGFASEIMVITHGTSGERRANAKSPVALMTLGAKRGDALDVEARGADAAAAVESVAHALGASETARSAPLAPRAITADIAPNTDEVEGPNEIRGIRAAPGLAVGVATRLEVADIAVPEQGRGVATEIAALAAARARVHSRAEAAARAPGADERRSAILGAHAALVDDPELASAAQRLIEQGKSAGFAWRAALAALRERLGALGDAYMAERIADLRDIERQVLGELGGASLSTRELPRDAILLAEEILPSELSALDASRIAGLCTAGGGPTSHVAILAAAMGVPALVAAGPRVLAVEEGASLVLDADAGVLRTNLSKEDLVAARSDAAARRDAAAAARARALDKGRTADGVRIQVYANFSRVDEIERALAQGAEGCGLLRTELLFQDRATAPSENEQRSEYQAVADALGALPLVIRTLDVGADKPVAFLPLAKEENPALGIRGLRATSTRPGILRDQLAAIAGVTPQPFAMLPMVTDVADIIRVREMLREIGGSAAVMELGAMIETPAAALLADKIAAVADFLSIGTNDLAQYTLAMDRGNPALAGAIDALHPAVLRLVAATAEGARAHGRRLGVCGGAASDPLAAPLLIGLGVDTLSAVPSAIPAIKGRLRSLSLADCREAAADALGCRDAGEVRALARERFGS